MLGSHQVLLYLRAESAWDSHDTTRQHGQMNGRNPRWNWGERRAAREQIPASATVPWHVNGKNHHGLPFSNLENAEGDGGETDNVETSSRHRLAPPHAQPIHCLRWRIGSQRFLLQRQHLPQPLCGSCNRRVAEVWRSSTKIENFLFLEVEQSWLFVPCVPAPEGDAAWCVREPCGRNTGYGVPTPVALHLHFQKLHIIWQSRARRSRASISAYCGANLASRTAACCWQRVFAECVARVPVSLWGSGGWGYVRSTLLLRPQVSATLRNRSHTVRIPSARGPYGRVMPMASSAKGVTFGGFNRCVASFRVAGVALCDIPTSCFITCQKSFCVAGAILPQPFAYRPRGPYGRAHGEFCNGGHFWKF